jgi:hypothetical protein
MVCGGILVYGGMRRWFSALFRAREGGIAKFGRFEVEVGIFFAIALSG